MDVTTPALTIAEAAAVAGLRAAYVRDVLFDFRLTLMAPPPRCGPAKASVADAFRFRVLRILRDAGFSEMHAVYVLDLSVDWRIAPLFAPGIPVQLGFLEPRLEGKAIHVVPDECDEFPDCYESESGVPSPDDAEIAITLHLGAIFAGVVADLKARKPSKRRTSGQESYS